jgi:hypothetical protein
MSYPRITFIIHGTTYSLCASETEAMRSIPGADRAQLITLLEALKHQDASPNEVVNSAVNCTKRSVPTEAATHTALGARAAMSQAMPERLGAGDVDALMARLVMEESQSKKQGLTKQSVYKGLAGFLVLVVLLVIIL